MQKWVAPSVEVEAESGYCDRCGWERGALLSARVYGEPLDVCSACLRELAAELDAAGLPTDEEWAAAVAMRNAEGLRRARAFLSRMHAGLATPPQRPPR